MKTKKSELILLSAALFVLLFSACGNKDPEVEPTPVTPEPMVKKYLVEQYLEDPNRVTHKIEWNEDYSQIKRISYSIVGSIAYFIDYDFTYYAQDSIVVKPSIPEGSIQWLMYDSYTCHLFDDGKIDSISLYRQNKYCGSWQYEYDNQGRLIAARDDYFIWEGENVIEGTFQTSDPVFYDKFGEGIHPHYTIPYLLPGVGSYDMSYITEPMWKNEYIHDGDDYKLIYEYDEDNYVVSVYRVDSTGNVRLTNGYRYETAN